MFTSTKKRKHHTLTIKEKSEILDRLNDGETVSGLANEYGVGRSTIYDIKNNTDNIQKFISTSDSGPGKRKTLKKANNPELEKALFTWFLQERSRCTTISGPLLIEKAKYFYTKITKKTDFVASKGWLDRFKNRHGIRLMALAGEELSNDATCVEAFKTKFHCKIKELGLCASQVYYANESGLFWRLLPNEEFIVHNDNSATEKQISEERVTILPCANASGLHALKLLIIGRKKDPNILKEELTLHYYDQKNAWMTKKLFKKWFHKSFIPEVRTWLKNCNLPQRALLVLDHSPGHPSEEELTSDDKCITTLFLPPNCTGIFLPAQQNIIQNLKKLYKNKILSAALTRNQPLEKTLKEFNLQDLITYLSYSWNQLPQSSITLSWKNLWPQSVSGVIPPQINLISSVSERICHELQINEEILNTWYNGVNEDLNSYHLLSDEEIIKQAMNPVIQCRKKYSEQACANVINGKSVEKLQDSAEVNANLKNIVVKATETGIESQKDILTNSTIYSTDIHVQENTAEKIVILSDSPINSLEVCMNWSEEKNEEDDSNTIKDRISAAKAIKAFEICMQWADENEVPYNELLLLRRMRDKAIVMTANES